MYYHNIYFEASETNDNINCLTTGQNQLLYLYCFFNQVNILIFLLVSVRNKFPCSQF